MVHFGFTKKDRFEDNKTKQTLPFSCHDTDIDTYSYILSFSFSEIIIGFYMSIMSNACVSAQSL